MKALKQVRILDLSDKLTGSLATMYLASYGAEVTKVEHPSRGDHARSWAPQREDGSIYFNYLNTGKKSITIDLFTEDGREILNRLLPMYDVICVNSAYGQLPGLSYEELKAIKSDLIYLSYSYYGDSGPYQRKPASSLTVQAKSVAMDMTGVHGDYPVRLSPSIAEHYQAAYIATGVVMALIDRNLRGIGQKVDIALLDSIYSCIEAAPAAYSTVGEIHKRKGNFDPSCAPYDTFKTSDGYVAIGVATQNQWLSFCDALNLQDLKIDSRFLDNESRRTDYMDCLRPILEKRLSTYTKADIEEKCRARGIPCSAVLTIPEITDLPNTLENGYMCPVESKKFGSLKYPSVPFSLSETPSIPFTDAPELGAHTSAILQQAGIGTEEQLHLREHNTI